MRRDSAYAATPFRAFGLIMGGVLAVAGAWPLVVRGQSASLWAFGGAAVLVILALFAPWLLRWPCRAWMAFGHVLGQANTPIILSVVFYAIVTPVGLAMRLWGYDFLTRRFDARSPTYRVRVEARDARHMAHQF